MEALLEQYDFDALEVEEVPEWDDPVWYTPEGELWSLSHLWYPSRLVIDTVLARLSEQEVFSLCQRYKHTRQWNRIRTESKYCNAEFVDRFFVNLGMPSFHTVLGAPTVASKCAPRENSPYQKLSAQDVFDIRKRKKAGERGIDLAREYGVSSDRIWRI